MTARRALEEFILTGETYGGGQDGDTLYTAIVPLSGMDDIGVAIEAFNHHVLHRRKLSLDEAVPLVKAARHA